MNAGAGGNPAGTPSIADELLTRLSGSPDAYPQKLDLVADKVLLVEFDAGAYRRASFLDDRILAPTTNGTWIAIGQAVEAARRAGERASTLILIDSGPAPPAPVGVRR